MYQPQHKILAEGNRNGILTGKAIGVVVADGVEGGNFDEVGEGAPSSVPELQGCGADIRPCLIGDGKWRNEGSPIVAEVVHGMRGGGRSSCPMMMNHEAKEAHQSGD
jgi:hypothetical protein